jgi:hypothetical protein
VEIEAPSLGQQKNREGNFFGPQQQKRQLHLHTSNPLQTTQEINEEHQQDGTPLTKNAENTSQETPVEEPSVA